MTAEQTAAILKAKGMRATPQRMAVFRYLLTHRVHPTAEQIYTALVKEYPSFSLTTVYNTLNALVEAGLAITVSIGENKLCYDGCIDFHGHFQCKACRKIYDFDVDHLEVSGLRAFAIDQKDVYFTGTCAECLAK